MDGVTTLIVFGVIIVLLIEIPWAMVSAWRIARRYRVRLVDSTIFRLLTRSVLQVAFVGGGLIGFLCFYSASRVLWPSIPPLPTGMFTLLLGIALVVLLYLPIAVDREMNRRAKSPDPNVSERDS